MDWNKDHIRETMLLLETAALHSARENYLDYVSTARLDRSEPIENDELAQAEVASDFAEALDDTLHDYANKLEKLRTIDFGPKLAVNEGAVVKLSGRHFVIAVSNGSSWAFPRSPIFATVQFNGRDLALLQIVGGDKLIIPFC
jgi:hypothetical protein